MKQLLTSTIIVLIRLNMTAQSQVPDTVEIELANTSKVVFTIQDRSDLEQLKEVDFQALFDDILLNLENTTVTESPSASEPVVIDPAETDHDDEPNFHTDYMENEERNSRRNKYPCSRQFFNADLGMNNFLHDGKFPAPGEAQYTVRPWGSWYVGLNAVHRLRFSRIISMEGSLGVSWYNFKFEDDNTLVTRTEDGVVFLADPDNSATKRKLTVSHINASMLFVLNAGGRKNDDECHRCNNSRFRIGAGPYVGYKIGSYAKQQFLEDGEKEFNRERDHFFLNNIRYGVRVQVGIHDTDFFIKYDLNDLFVVGKGPKLNAYSFGVIF